MKPATKSYLILILVALVAVSCGPVTTMPTVTKIIIPTNTIAPTDTKLPEPSPTATLSQAEETLILPTRHPLGDSTPTPISTPAFNISATRLRALSEEDFFSLILEMNEYSYQNFPSFEDWWTDSRFISSQEPVALAIQEYLYHFPESSNADRLRWQLAFINSIMYNGLAGNLYGDEWMIGELENRLIRRETSPDQLETILGKYWFDVIYIQPMENLFADGKTGWLYQVAPQVWADSGYDNNHSVGIGSMFFVVRETDEGKFEIHLLNSAWNFSFGVSHVFDITDHNENGIPEVALFIGSHSGTMCEGNLFIYEWKEGGFDELTKGNLSLRDCVETFEYSERQGTPAITFSGIYPIRTEQYIWNGEFYEFSSFLDATPLGIWQNSIGKSHFSYEAESKLINEILASGEAAEFRASYADYLRYRLGVVYALQSKQEDAVRELENLIASPLDPTRTVFTDMARKFLEIYEGDRTVYESCFQSRLVYDNAFDQTGSFDDAEYEETFGIPFDPFTLGFSTCDERYAFELMAKSIPVTVEDIPAELRKNGVNVDFSKRIDANLDGNVDEWFVIVDTYDQFLVFPQSPHYQAKRLDLGIGDEHIDYFSTKVSVESWNNFPHPVMIVQSGDEFVLLELDETYESKALIYDFGVKEYATTEQGSVPEVQLFFSMPSPNSYFPDHPYDGYRWSASEQKFKNDLLEYSMFILQDPKRVVEIAEKVLPRLETWKNIPDIERWSLPYAYYLVGLSYELSDDQEKATQIYWQLWHDFPDSHYARLAEFKLEPINP